MQKTMSIWKRIEEVSNNGKLNNESREIKQKLDLANAQIKNVESMDEYNSISQEIQDLQNQLKGIEIEIRLRPRIENAVRTEERKKIKDTYNQEFKPHYDKYVKLDKQLKKQLNDFAKATGPIVKEMVEIENLERSLHSLKTQAIGETRQLISLPVDNKGFERPYSSINGMAHSTANKTENVINAINKNWG